MGERLVYVSGALIQNQERFLLAQRCPEDRFGGMWEFPGGSIEPKETAEACIVRELKEELDIESRVLERLAEFSDELPDLKIIVYLFLCGIVSGIPKCLECQNVGWYTIDEMLRLSLAPLDIKIQKWLTSQHRFSRVHL